ncbi:hypothetical protein RND71_015701 [Anisodus tanguticus]|uniref:Uncharacterized protein n=1 Tax=Anisodus tanguticus TaxID=243964 RepID=A0AAE1VC22_9SOLA|nr:hypothetical protein RND71_015701 [Anisodus tanguticus]
MGSEYRSRKFHYDVSKSRRTRKALNLNAVSHNGEERKYERKSLKELMIEARSISLRQHLIEDQDNQLQMLVDQQPQKNGFKFKKILRRYIKVLCHMIKRKKYAGYRIQIHLQKSKS